MTTGECWRAIAPHADISKRSFDRDLASWRATGEAPPRLIDLGIVADLERRSRFPDRSNQARWLRIEK